MWTIGLFWENLIVPRFHLSINLLCILEAHSQFSKGCGKVVVSRNIRCSFGSWCIRLNTKAMLQRKNFFMDDYSCIMCGTNGLETRNHLFFLCPFAHTHIKLIFRASWIV
jgi:hypothetical protein